MKEKSQKTGNRNKNSGWQHTNDKPSPFPPCPALPRVSRRSPGALGGFARTSEPAPGVCVDIPTSPGLVSPWTSVGAVGDLLDLLVLEFDFPSRQLEDAGAGLGVGTGKVPPANKSAPEHPAEGHAEVLPWGLWTFLSYIWRGMENLLLPLNPSVLFIGGEEPTPELQCRCSDKPGTSAAINLF